MALAENSRVALQDFSFILDRTTPALSWLFVDGDTTQPMDLTGFTFRMDVVDAKGVIRFTYQTSDGTLEVPNPTSGVLVMPPRLNSVPSGCYVCELKATAPNGVIASMWRGKFNSVNYITE